MIVRASVMIAITCSLLGRASAAQVQSAPGQRSEYPNNPVLPVDFMSLVL
jgi:hypothetical protein